MPQAIMAKMILNSIIHVLLLGSAWGGGNCVYGEYEGFWGYCRYWGFGTGEGFWEGWGYCELGASWGGW